MRWIVFFPVRMVKLKMNYICHYCSDQERQMLSTSYHPLDAPTINFEGTFLHSKYFTPDVRKLVEDLLFKGPPLPITNIFSRREGELDNLYVERGVAGWFLHGVIHTETDIPFKLVSWTESEGVCYAFGHADTEYYVIQFPPNTAHAITSHPFIYTMDDTLGDKPYVIVHSTPAYDVVFNTTRNRRGGYDNPYPCYKEPNLPVTVDQLPLRSGFDTVAKYVLTDEYLHVISMPDDATDIALWTYKVKGGVCSFRQMANYEYSSFTNSKEPPLGGNVTRIATVGIYNLYIDEHMYCSYLRVKPIRTFDADTQVEFREGSSRHDTSCRMIVNGKELATLEDNIVYADVYNGQIRVLIGSYGPACPAYITTYNCNKMKLDRLVGRRTNQVSLDLSARASGLRSTIISP
jgi:hypothetical protein